MFRIHFIMATGFFVIKDESGQTLFASKDEHSTEAALMALRLDSDPGYQAWLAANDAMLEAV
jgi:hypothetical protein